MRYKYITSPPSISFRLVIPINRFLSTASNSATKKPSFLEKAKQQFQIFKSGIAQLQQETQEKALIHQKGGIMTRKEFQLVHRNDQDLQKLVPFILISILLPEIIPIIVFKFSHLIPSIFITKDQMETKRQALDLKRKEIAFAFLNEARLKEVESDGSLDLENAVDQLPAFLEANPELYSHNHLDWAKLQQIALFFGLSFWNIPYFLRKDIERHLEYLRKDEEYLASDEITIESLSLEELQAACENRGISSLPDSARRELEDRMRIFSSWIKSKLPNEKIAVAQIIFDGLERELKIGSRSSPLNSDSDDQ